MPPYTPPSVADSYKLIVQKSAKLMVVHLQGPRTNINFVTVSSDRSELLLDWLVASTARLHGIKVEEHNEAPTINEVNIELPNVQESGGRE